MSLSDDLLLDLHRQIDGAQQTAAQYIVSGGTDAYAHAVLQLGAPPQPVSEDVVAGPDDNGAVQFARVNDANGSPVYVAGGVVIKAAHDGKITLTEKQVLWNMMNSGCDRDGNPGYTNGWSTQSSNNYPANQIRTPARVLSRPSWWFGKNETLGDFAPNTIITQAESVEGTVAAVKALRAELSAAGSGGGDFLPH